MLENDDGHRDASKTADSAQKLFATNVKRFRQERQPTQEQVADLAGLPPNYIRLVERGKRNVPICDIERIAIALGVTMADLLAKPKGE